MTELTTQSSFSPSAPAESAEIGEFKVAVADSQQRSRYSNLLAMRRSLQARAQRGRFFNPNLFADPAWDMLLELYAAFLTQRRLPVSRLAERSGVPMTTALRWISTLEREELVERRADPFDRRRIFLTLSSKAAVAMTAYFDTIAEDTKLL